MLKPGGPSAATQSLCGRPTRRPRPGTYADLAKQLFLNPIESGAFPCSFPPSSAHTVALTRKTETHAA
eukprot:2091474-Rhodomonas_salina.1